MSAAGSLRKVDPQGCITIPKEIRTTADIDAGTPVEIWVEGDKIILQKHQQACVFCDSISNNAVEIAGHCVCKECIADAKKLAESKPCEHK